MLNVEWFLVLRNPLVDTSKQFDRSTFENTTYNGLSFKRLNFDQIFTTQQISVQYFMFACCKTEFHLVIVRLPVPLECCKIKSLIHHIFYHISIKYSIGCWKIFKGQCCLGC